MRKIDDGNVLKVRLYKVGSTLFGPSANPIATYVFIQAD
jgi:hypothetical protein